MKNLNEEPNSLYVEEKYDAFFSEIKNEASTLATNPMMAMFATLCCEILDLKDKVEKLEIELKQTKSELFEASLDSDDFEEPEYYGSRIFEE